MLKDLREKLDMPFVGSLTKKKESRLVQEELVSQGPKKQPKKRKEPVQKILKTNEKVVRFVALENKKLLRILDRIELDKPIMMHDKLDVIWDKGPQQPQSNSPPASGRQPAGSKRADNSLN